MRPLILPRAGRAGALAALLVIAACGRANEPVVIATAGPWQAANGAMHKRGVDLAIEQINAAGGIDGRQVTLVDRDDEASGSKAAAIAGEFVADPSILAVVGHVNSGAMMAAARVYDGQLAAVSSTASSPDISGLSRWVFRVIASDSASAIHLARFANARDAERAVVLYENNAFGRGLVEPFRRNFGGTLTADPIPSDASANFEPYISYIRMRNPDIVFVAGSEGSGLALLREARRQGLTVPFMGGIGWAGITADTGASEGAYVGVPFTVEDKRPEAQRFVEAFRGKFGRDPDAKAALAYDATMLIARAIGEAGADRAAIRDWLGSLRAPRTFSGVTSRAIQFDSSGDVTTGGFVMTRVQQGNLSVLANAR